MAIRDRLKHAWNAFVSKEEETYYSAAASHGVSYSSRPDRVRMRISSERSIVSSIYTRIGIDVADVVIRHVRLDDNDQYIETIKSGLNYCLNVEANIDQGARAFRQDLAMTLFDEGVVAIIPVDTDFDPTEVSGFKINSLRVAKILEWMPRHIRVSAYDDRDGRRKEIVVPKSSTAIIENPLYAVMNEPNSTLQRLTRKLSLLDAVDEASSSGKLDLIVQLPYTIKSDLRKEQAANRAKDIEVQLKGSKYGIAYIDGTEKVTQLNRPAENNMLAQVKFLTEMLYSQLGLTEGVFNGTAEEKVMVNYHNRTIKPILTTITQEMKRSFLTKTAISQKQSVEFFRDPFALVSAGDIAELADKLTRNEIMSTNEVRSIIGFRPSADPKADELRNKNLPAIPEPNKIDETT